MAGLMLLRALAAPGGVGVTLFPEHSSSETCPIVDEGSPLVTSGLALSLCLGALRNLGGVHCPEVTVWSVEANLQGSSAPWRQMPVLTGHWLRALAC